MKVRMLKDWGWQKQGEVTEVFDPLAANWVANGIAEYLTDARTVPAERADDTQDGVERAVMTEKRRPPKRPA